MKHLRERMVSLLGKIEEPKRVERLESLTMHYYRTGMPVDNAIRLADRDEQQERIRDHKRHGNAARPKRGNE